MESIGRCAPRSGVSKKWSRAELQLPGVLGNALFPRPPSNSVLPALPVGPASFLDASAQGGPAQQTGRPHLELGSAPLFTDAGAWSAPPDGLHRRFPVWVLHSTPAGTTDRGGDCPHLQTINPGDHHFRVLRSTPAGTTDRGGDCPHLQTINPGDHHYITPSPHGHGEDGLSA
ncbi:hypothetical protein NDU88_005039 [Pleurodeles waltl]|uniref:Uncharacterized protein n=1 Tax=Pleurodeles waltl TaxID=8319 RepID=A0AAV7VM38_PLEWA|nr:hypothetical protein NDU88_005039 [Pleurodeles waltl]